MGVFDNEKVLSETPEYTITDKDYEHWLRVIVGDKTGETLFSQDVWISKLPVLYIDTEDGEPITTKEYYVPANLRIQGNEEYEQQYLGTTQVKGRGNSSWIGYPQKPYKLKLDNKTSLFGFGKSRHWVLISNFNDKCGLRNYIASQLAKKLGVIGMNMTWVDVVVNGEAKGCYMLSQHVRVEKHSVNVFDWESEAENIANPLFSWLSEERTDLTVDDLTLLEDSMKRNFSWVTSGLVNFKEQAYDLVDYGLKQEYNVKQGYLIEAKGESNRLNGFKTPKGVFLEVKVPERVFTNEEMMSVAVDVWNNFEAECCQEPSSKGKEYEKYADVQSMIGIWLVNEIMAQGDPDNSRFSHIPEDGRLHFGPVWDFDHSSACWSTSKKVNNFYTLENREPHTYFQYWFPDPVLCQQAFDIYWEVARPFMTDYLSEGGEMDKKYDFIAKSLETNDHLWGTYPSLLYPSAQPRTAKEDFEILKDFLRKHMDWLDQQLESPETFIDATNEFCPYPYKEAQIARKVIQDKRLYVIRGAKRYSISGQRIK